MMQLRDQFSEWTDLDSAEYLLAVHLGIVGPDTSFNAVKWMFWSDNRFGNALYDILKHLELLGAIEFDEEKDGFRWNPSFPVDGKEGAGSSP